MMTGKLFLPVSWPVVLLLSAAVAPGAEAPSLAGLPFEASSAGAIPAIATVEVTVRAGAKIDALLRAGRIDPDGDALSAVYLLNPDLRNVGALKAGQPLVLPAVQGADTLPAGARVRLNLVPQVKRDLLATSRSLDVLVPRLHQLPPARLGEPDEREEAVGALDEILGYLGELHGLIQGDRAPVSPEMLIQSLAGARAVQKILERTLSSSRPLSDADRETIVHISEDMNLKARNFDEIRGPGKERMRWRDVGVTVTVVRSADQSPVPGLRVFYAPEALAREPGVEQSFPGTSPRVSRRLLEGDYVFWAAAPGGATPATAQVRQQIRRDGGGEVEIRLVVRGGPAR